MWTGTQAEASSRIGQAFGRDLLNLELQTGRDIMSADAAAAARRDALLAQRLSLDTSSLGPGGAQRFAPGDKQGGPVLTPDQQIGAGLIDPTK